MTFDATRTYQRDLDVRDWHRWRDRLQGEPEGVLWALIGARRSGKTWALNALASRDTTYVNLQSDSHGLEAKHNGRCLLVDEPGAVLRRERLAFIEHCAELKREGIRVLIAMTPGEWHYLTEIDPHERHIKARDASPLPLLTIEQSAKMARIEWAQRLVAALPADWRRNPFLIELLLEEAEERPDLQEDIDKLLFAAIRSSAQGRFRYVQSVFEEGLSDCQRAYLRGVARGACAIRDQEILMQCGLVDAGPRLADPILRDHFRQPLIVHHISDVHFGPKTASFVDAKEPGEHGRRLAQASGARSVRDDYVAHLESCGGDRPNAILVSGDLVETGQEEQYKEARAFLDGLSNLVAPHPDFRPDDRRIAIVGGNHDVDWSETRGREGARKRHLAFARHMAGYPHPHLEQPPVDRALSTITWPGVGVEIALLGSSEFGGEDDETQQKLVQMIDALAVRAREAFASHELAQFDELSKRLSRLDPGLVDYRDLKKLESHDWTQTVRIAVLHHPVSPMPVATEIARFGGLINAGAVKASMLRAGVCLVLHGHQHSGWFGRESWPGRFGGRAIHVAAAPTLGSRETIENLGFNEIRIYREGATCFEVEVRRVAYTGTGWDKTSDVMSFRLESAQRND